MRLIEHAYDSILSAVGRRLPALLPRGGFDDPLFQAGRQGKYSSFGPASRSRPRIWFHAASVGEVNGALPVLKTTRSTFPQASLFLTTGTPQGYGFARSKLLGTATVLPFPLDFTEALNRAFDFIQPDLYVAFESELWPNLFRLLRARRVPSLLLNGRLSRRSVSRYKLLKPLFGPIFKQLSWLAMHSRDDGRRALELGAPAHRVLVLGSAKYDGLLLKARPENPEWWRGRLDIPSSAPVMVGGSLRRTECTQLLRVHEALSRMEPELVGLFAPRHLERLTPMIEWLRTRGVPYQRLSRIEAGRETRKTTVVLVDKMGVLFDLYALGDLIFCGGTMEPVGGHNILEPAAWGRPVFYGPHVEKVRQEQDLLESHGGGFCVNDWDELLAQWREWMTRLPELKRRGDRAGEALETMAGAAAKQMELMRHILSSEGFAAASPKDCLSTDL